MRRRTHIAQAETRPCPATPPTLPGTRNFANKHGVSAPLWHAARRKARACAGCGAPDLRAWPSSAVRARRAGCVVCSAAFALAVVNWLLLMGAAVALFLASRAESSQQGRTHAVHGHAHTCVWPCALDDHPLTRPHASNLLNMVFPGSETSTHLCLLNVVVPRGARHSVDTVSSCATHADYSSQINSPPPMMQQQQQQQTMAPPAQYAQQPAPQQHTQQPAPARFDTVTGKPLGGF